MIMVSNHPTPRPAGTTDQKEANENDVLAERRWRRRHGGAGRWLRLSSTAAPASGDCIGLLHVGSDRPDREASRWRPGGSIALLLRNDRRRIDSTNTRATPPSAR